MFNSYRRSLIDLYQSVRALQRNPLSERNTCLPIQLRLLKKIIYIERRISQNRDILKQHNVRLKSKRAFSLSEAEVQLIKDDISKRYALIDEYQNLLLTFRTIGDALAFIYLDKWDIKPQAFKQSPGFVSGKSGLRHELRLLRLVFSIGGVALLNDLTNCLRYGDISVVRNQRSLIIEVKSSHKRNARIRRQISELESMRDYLNYGISDKEYGFKGEKVDRVLIHSPEIHHMDELNQVIKRAISSPTGFCLEQVEHGLYYGATYLKTENFVNALTQIAGVRNSNKFIVCYVNELKYSGIGYYPFSLSIYDPNAWYAFCSGQLMVTVLASLEVIEDKLQSHGLYLKFDFRQDFALEITNIDPNSIGTHLVSKHFLGRLFSEFLSLDWLLDEIIYQSNTDVNTKNSQMG